MSLTVLKGCTSYALESMRWLRDAFRDRSSKLMRLVRKFLRSMELNAVALFRGVLTRGERLVNRFVSRVGVQLCLQDVVHLVDVSKPRAVLGHLYNARLSDIRGQLIRIVQEVPDT